MKTVCPSCGAIHSAEALFSDAEARQCLKVMVEMPGSVGRHLLPYLALFRGNQGRVLQWRRALVLASELRDLATAAHVQRGHNVARPNSPAFWAEAMGRIVAMPPARLPLKSHGYLAAMVYDLADEADKAAERDRNTAVASGTSRAASKPGAAMSVEEMRRIRDTNMNKVKGVGL